MAVGLRQFTNRADNGHPLLDAHNGEELTHVQPAVSVVFDNRSPETLGTLYITTRQVIWLSEEDKDKGYAVDFLSITLHAVSRDPEAYPSPCIYAQIETDDDGDFSEDSDSDSESSGILDLSKVTEMRLVPSDPTQVDTLFEVFCECAELNPEPTGEDEEEGSNWILSADQTDNNLIAAEGGEWLSSENTIGYSNGNSDLAHRVLELQISDQCFEDAEEDPEINSEKH
ncbi:hypothetical protein ACFE04_004442 [Oxalis oulophora]